MGRGRAKAKQTKVARDLKYSNTDFDPTALARELHGSPGGSYAPSSPVEADEDVDGWEDFATRSNS